MASSTSGSGPSAAAQGDLFPSVGSSNFLEFEFGGKSYSQQLQEAVQTTGKFSAVTVEIRQLNVRPFRDLIEGLRVFGGRADQKTF